MGHLRRPWQALCLASPLIVMVQVKGSEVQPFIYLQF